MRRFILTLTLCCLCLAAAAQAIKKDFKPICDSLSAKIQERTGVYGVLRLQNVMK